MGYNYDNADNECPSYTDALGYEYDSFTCPRDYIDLSDAMYCCGTTQIPFCCNTPGARILEDIDGVYGAVLAVVIILGIVFIFCIGCCCVCCYFCTRKNNNRSPQARYNALDGGTVSTTTTNTTVVHKSPRSSGQGHHIQVAQNPMQPHQQQYNPDLVAGPLPPATYIDQPGGYPSQARYPLPASYPPQPGYPLQSPGYPTQPTGYPTQPMGYPTQPKGYPTQPKGYPTQTTGYPTQPTVYQPPNPGQSQSAFSPLQTGYPTALPGYPSPQGAYPPEIIHPDVSVVHPPPQKSVECPSPQQNVVYPPPQGFVQYSDPPSYNEAFRGQADHGFSKAAVPQGGEASPSAPPSEDMAYVP